VSYVEVKRQRQRELIAALHPGVPTQAPARSDGPPNFDGGARPPGERDRSLPWYRSFSPKLPRDWEPAPDD
jgi:hypothetical protein